MSKARIFFDAHVHVYPEFDIDVLLSTFAANAERLAPGADALAMAVMLRSFQPGLRAALGACGAPGVWRLEEAPGGSFIATDGTRRIYLLPARQVAARERIEALGLFGDAMIPDGLPLEETFSRLREAGFRPVLAWGLGKWLFKRARVVKTALDGAAQSGGDLLVGDSALRPAFWSKPRPFTDAEARGMRVIYGSDPLPRKGDDHSAGRYATLIEAPFDPLSPAASILAALGDRSAAVSAVGRRYGLADTLKRV